MNINAIVSIQESTGKIIRVILPQLDVPPEGVVDGIRTVYLTDWSLANTDYANFMQNYWFNTSNLEFFEVGDPPNAYAEWDLSSSAWTWDANLVLTDIRSKRSILLLRTDWTQVSDNTLTDAQREEARTYRTALRNITSSLSNPENVEDVTWPTPPSFL